MDLNLEPDSGMMYYAFSPDELFNPNLIALFELERLPRLSMLGIVTPFDNVSERDIDSGFECYDLIAGPNGHIRAWWQSANIHVTPDKRRVQIRQALTAPKQAGRLLYEFRGSEDLIVVASTGPQRDPHTLRAILAAHYPSVSR